MMSKNEDSLSKLSPADDAGSDSDASAGEEKAAAPAPAAANTETKDPPNRYEKLERLKREKRLAMNRECARARRRRKKLRMEMLENRVQELTQKNSKILETNEVLRARVMQLEAELGAAKSGMAMFASGDVAGAGMGAAGMGGPAGFMLGSGAPGRMNMNMNMNAGLPGDAANQALIAEKLSLQRRAALVGLGGATTGFGNLPGGAQGANNYMQLMQANKAMGGGGGAGAGEDQMKMMARNAGGMGSQGFSLPGGQDF